MPSELQQMGAAFFGAAVQEIAHWYDLRQHLHTPDYQSMIRSKGYWIATILMMIVSPIGTWILYSEQTLPLSTYFILGAAFPLILKKGVAAVGEQQKAGGGKTEAIKSYFRLR